jgi:hypothetical protein
MYLVSVILVIREGEEYIRYLDSHFSQIESNYKNILKFEYFMYENDSHDKTKKEIKLFFENRDGKYLCESVPNSKMMSGISIERGTTMGKFRNKLKKLHGRLKSNFVVLLNCDTIFSLNSITSMINTLLESRETSMVTGYPICYGSYLEENETNHYYDSLSLITENNIGYKQTGNSCPFKKCARCKMYRNINRINVPEEHLLDNKNLINVKSAFGGLALLKTSVYNIVDWGESVSEHHSFCENVRKFGTIVINPNIKFFTTKKIFSLKYKIIQRILKNVFDIDKLVASSINTDADDSDNTSEPDENVEQDDTNENEIVSINNVSKKKETQLNEQQEEYEIVKRPPKEPIKNPLFNELYNFSPINRFSENSESELYKKLYEGYDALTKERKRSHEEDDNLSEELENLSETKTDVEKDQEPEKEKNNHKERENLSETKTDVEKDQEPKKEKGSHKERENLSETKTDVEKDQEPEKEKNNHKIGFTIEEIEKTSSSDFSEQLEFVEIPNIHLKTLKNIKLLPNLYDV